MSDADRQKSLREFDYFAEGLSPSASETQDDEIEPPRRSRLILGSAVRVVLALAAIGVSTWLVWGMHGWITYSLSGSRKPLALGDVATMTPATIPHNEYVSLSGITEHRGLTQKGVRGLSLDRHEWWYMRLAGSRGVFIAVEPDPERYGIATEVAVSGRAVDPRREDCCEEVFATYLDRFSARPMQEMRVILVGERPGEHRVRYVALGVGLLAIWLSAAATIYRAVRRLRKPRLPLPAAAGRD